MRKINKITSGTETTDSDNISRKIRNTDKAIKRYIGFCILIFFLAFLKISPCIADNFTDLPSTTSFRPGSYITVLGGIQQSRWQVKNAGSIPSIEDKIISPSLILRYTFHLQIQKKFGYLVGTDVELSAEQGQLSAPTYKASCGNTTFTPNMGVSFPSILFGLVQNYVENSRVILLASYSATWYPWMKACNFNSTKTYDITAFPHSFNASILLDVYKGSQFAWTIGVQAQQKFIDCIGTPLICTTNTSKTSVLEKFSMNMFGLGMQAGVTWLFR